MLKLQIVEENDRELLWNINQKYLYEMTCFYDDPMDENGNYHYGHFDDYFTDPSVPSQSFLQLFAPSCFRMLRCHQSA